MADTWHGYFIVGRITANLSQSNWDDLLDLIRQIQTSGIRAEYLLQERMSLDGNQDTFEANYAEGAVSFDKFSQKLAETFGVPIEGISYVTAVQDNTVYATYIYDGDNRFRLGLFGCPNDVNLCDWETSRQACSDYLVAHSEEWEEALQ